MDYIKLWEKYQDIKNKLDSRSFSSHTQIRSALLKPVGRAQKICLERYEDICMIDGEGKKINTLTELLLSTPDTINITGKKVNLQIYRTSTGNTEVSRGINKNQLITKNTSLKEIPEEVFWYLWEKSEEWVDRMFLSFRLLTPCVIKRSDYDIRLEETLERILGRSGMKVTELPPDIPSFDTLINPFIFGNKILLTEDSRNYLLAMKEDRLQRGIKEVEGLNKLLDLWTTLKP